MYAQVFEEANALDKLEGFTSRFGPAFYGLALNTQKLTLIKEDTRVPAQIPFGEEQLIPFWADQTLRFKQVLTLDNHHD
jgi:dihydroorotase